MYSDDSSSDSDVNSSDTDCSDSEDDSTYQEVANSSSQWALANAQESSGNSPSRIDFENEKIFITVRRRVRKKYVTIVSGLASNGFDTNLILTALRKQLRCGGTVTSLLRKRNGHMSGVPKGRSGATRCVAGDLEPVIQFNGDHHIAVRRFLVSQGICKAVDIVCKGATVF